MDTTRWWTKATTVLALGIVLTGVGFLDASPAAADGTGPTRYESVIDDVEPDLDQVEVSVVGGDAFLQVVADDGTEVSIDGYDGEPYLRIDADGSVWENRRSPSVYLNATRDGGDGRFPQGVSSGAEPDWQQVGDDGVVAWHDHRIHWMLDEEPTVGTDGVVQEWELPMDVDGTEVVVTGRLLLKGSVFPWAAAVAVVAAAGALVAGRGLRGRLVTLTVASAAAIVVAVAAYTVNPPRSGASVVPLVLTVVAAVCVAASWWAARSTGRSLVQLALPLAAVAALLGWVVQRLGTFWMATVPSELPGWLDRALTGMVLGAAVGTAAAVLLRPWPEERLAGAAAQDSSTGSSPPSNQS